METVRVLMSGQWGSHLVESGATFPAGGRLPARQVGRRSSADPPSPPSKGASQDQPRCLGGADALAWYRAKAMVETLCLCLALAAHTVTLRHGQPAEASCNISACSAAPQARLPSALQLAAGAGPQLRAAAGSAA